MAVQPDTDRRLDRTSKKLAGNGARFLVFGLVLYAIGAVLLLTDLTTVGGLLFIGIATPPTLAAIALLISGGTGHHAAKHRPFV
jgi:hypothetical protein